MTETLELRRRLDELIELAARTSQDVTWIRNGLEKGDERMDLHERRIGKVEGRQHWYAGAATVVGIFLGALVDHLRLSWFGGPPH